MIFTEHKTTELFIKNTMKDMKIKLFHLCTSSTRIIILQILTILTLKGKKVS